MLTEGSGTLRCWKVGEAPEASFPDTFAAFRAELDSGRYIVKQMYATSPELDRLAEGLDVESALKVYDGLRAAGAVSNSRQADKFLVNYLRKYPDTSFDLVALLAGDPDYSRFTQDEHLHLWLLLTEAGHRQAQQATVDAARNPDYGRDTRIRAMLYVSSFAYPDKATVDELWEMYGKGVQGEDEKTNGEVRTMSLLALGVLGDGEKLNDAVKPVIAGRLTEALQGAPDSFDERMALRAVGNSGNPDLLPAVTPYFESAEPLVRGRCLQSSAKHGHPGSRTGAHTGFPA